MDYDIFKTEEEKAYARQQLEELLSSGGWKLIQKALDINIQHLQEELDTKRDHDNKEQLYLTLDRQNDLRSLKLLPKLLLEETVPDTSPVEDDDVFDTPASNPN